MVKSTGATGSRDWGLWANLGAVAVALASVVALQWPGQRTGGVNLLNPTAAEQQEALQLGLVARSPTLGFDNLIANWAFLRFVLYFGDEEARNQTNSYELNYQYFDLLTKRDPLFTQAYLFISTAVSFNQGKPEKAIELMDRGTSALSPQIDPQAYLLWRYKGIDQLLLLGDVPGSIYSHQKAAEWVQGTPDQDFAPLYQQTAEFLQKNPDSKPVRIWAWSDVYYNAVDKKVQQRAEAELLKLGATKRVNDNGQVIFTFPTSGNPN
ncbi:MAG TPA: hypothetical protein IGS52_14130 [Oscillatoriaceae cyanobacterium M33_DOE_052]|uniref:Tetratricopeptide repeat protein n=1 Tax=Planktothricoides sp. SpSt-374 TaxID=2282167 RepID=A0A7C3ZUC7_9CYAN|nr:hypothetical protein [Oscillatoriaceae cyanobacterium M33_DOE_052]